MDYDPNLLTSDLEPQDVTFLRKIPARVEGLGMFGMADIVNALVVALLGGGHVLLEGNPGLGKTRLVRALSEALGLGRDAMGRIQFTPDLMPADITGTLMPADEGSGRLVFKRGPIFCNLLLADEINRATPKTQAAMLEAMAEGQVTVLGQRHDLRPDRGGWREPFMVMATQNPIEQDGTYRLPEAQSDRFMFKINLTMPGRAVMARIMDKALQPEPPPDSTPHDPGAMERLHRISEALMSIRPLPEVSAHINNIIQASNHQFDEVEGVSGQRRAQLEQMARRITYPLGPRAGEVLIRSSVGWAGVVLVAPEQAASGATPLTARALAETLLPALRHRLGIDPDRDDMTTPAAEARALDAFIAEFASLAAPEGTGGTYPGDFRAALAYATGLARVRL